MDERLMQLAKEAGVDKEDWDDLDQLYEHIDTHMDDNDRDDPFLLPMDFPWCVWVGDDGSIYMLMEEL